MSTVPLDGDARLDLAALTRALRNDTALVSIMYANNEVGTLQDIAEIAKLAHARGALVHTDAAQSVGKIPLDVDALGVDMLTIAGHAFYATKGVGALYVRRGTPIAPVIVGAEHEQGLRPGTENVPAIVGLGEAARLARERLESAAVQLHPRSAARSRRRRLPVQAPQRLIRRGAAHDAAGRAHTQSDVRRRTSGN